MAEDLGLSPFWIFGAFSLAMVVSALVGPLAGARVDGAGGRGVPMLSRLVFAAGLGLLLFVIDLKLAGSLSLVISLPTMLVGFARYSLDDSFSVVARNRGFVALTAVGSVIGVAVGGQLLGIVPGAVLLPVLVAILPVSSIKGWRHG